MVRGIIQHGQDLMPDSHTEFKWWSACVSMLCVWIHTLHLNLVHLLYQMCFAFTTFSNVAFLDTWQTAFLFFSPYVEGVRAFSSSQHLWGGSDQNPTEGHSQACQQPLQHVILMNHARASGCSPFLPTLDRTDLLLCCFSQACSCGFSVLQHKW